MSEMSIEREAIFTASKKWRRAVLRHERLTFSVQEVAALLDVGMGKLIAQAAEDRLCVISAERRPRTTSASKSAEPNVLPSSRPEPSTKVDAAAENEGLMRHWQALRVRGREKEAADEQKRRQSYEGRMKRAAAGSSGDTA